MRAQRFEAELRQMCLLRLAIARVFSGAGPRRQVLARSANGFLARSASGFFARSANGS